MILTRRKLNIKDTVLDSAKTKEELLFDPMRDIPSEEWEHQLFKLVQASKIGSWEMYLRLAAPLAIINPRAFTLNPTVLIKAQNRLADWVSRSVGGESLIDHLVNLKILENAFQTARAPINYSAPGLIEIFKNQLSQNNQLRGSYAGMICKLLIIYNGKIPFEMSGLQSATTYVVDMQSLLYSSIRLNWGHAISYLFYLKILFPDDFQKNPISTDDWKKLLQGRSTMEHVMMLKVIAAPYVKITENGFEFSDHSQHKDLESKIPLPQQRNF